MERFTIKFNKKKRTLNKICRLCGIENPKKFPILEEFLSTQGEVANNTNGEPELPRKIFECVGIQVTKVDKMPQFICSICYDKINDFYEFREMCLSTNLQTRRLLGLPEMPDLCKIDQLDPESVLRLEKNARDAMPALATETPISPMKRRSIVSTFPLNQVNEAKNKQEQVKCMDSKFANQGKQRLKQQQNVKPDQSDKASRTKCEKKEFVTRLSRDRESSNKKSSEIQLSHKKPIIKNERKEQINKKIVGKRNVKHEKIFGKIGEEKIESRLENKSNKSLVPKTQVQVVVPLNSAKPTKRRSTGKQLLTAKKKKLVAENKEVFSSDSKDISVRNKQSLENSTTTETPHKEICEICDNEFPEQESLQKHLQSVHVPNIVPYYCIYCDEIIFKKMDIKNHNLWHKLAKTPFKCGRCDKILESLVGYTRHVHECSAFESSNIVATISCEKCKKDFETENLYNWHRCIINSRVCPKCERKLPKKYDVKKHIMYCSVSSKKIVNEDEKNDISLPEKNSVEKEMAHAVKNNKTAEEADQFFNSMEDENSAHKLNIISRENIQPTGDLQNSNYMTVINIEQGPLQEKNRLPILEMESSIESIKKELITSQYCAFDISSIDVRIKQELIDSEYGDVIDLCSPEREPQNETAIISTKPAIKLKIRKELGTMHSSLVGELHDFTSTHSKQKKSKRRKLEEMLTIHSDDDFGSDFDFRHDGYSTDDNEFLIEPSNSTDCNIIEACSAASGMQDSDNRDTCNLERTPPIILSGLCTIGECNENVGLPKTNNVAGPGIQDSDNRDTCNSERTPPIILAGLCTIGECSENDSSSKTNNISAENFSEYGGFPKTSYIAAPGIQESDNRDTCNSERTPPIILTGVCTIGECSENVSSPKTNNISAENLSEYSGFPKTSYIAAPGIQESDNRDTCNSERTPPIILTGLCTIGECSENVSSPKTHNISAENLIEKDTESYNGYSSFPVITSISSEDIVNDSIDVNITIDNDPRISHNDNFDNSLVSHDLCINQTNKDLSPSQVCSQIDVSQGIECTAMSYSNRTDNKCLQIEIKQEYEEESSINEEIQGYRVEEENAEIEINDVKKENETEYVCKHQQTRDLNVIQTGKYDYSSDSQQYSQGIFEYSEANEKDLLEIDKTENQRSDNCIDNKNLKLDLRIKDVFESASINLEENSISEKPNNKTEDNISMRLENQTDSENIFVNIKEDSSDGKPYKATASDAPIKIEHQMDDSYESSSPFINFKGNLCASMSNKIVEGNALIKVENLHDDFYENLRAESDVSTQMENQCDDFYENANDFMKSEDNPVIDNVNRLVESDVSIKIEHQGYDSLKTTNVFGYLDELNVVPPSGKVVQSEAHVDDSFKSANVSVILKDNINKINEGGILTKKDGNITDDLFESENVFMNIKENLSSSDLERTIESDVRVKIEHQVVDSSDNISLNIEDNSTDNKPNERDFLLKMESRLNDFSENSTAQNNFSTKIENQGDDSFETANISVNFSQNLLDDGLNRGAESNILMKMEHQVDDSLKNANLEKNLNPRLANRTAESDVSIKPENQSDDSFNMQFIKTVKIEYEAEHNVSNSFSPVKQEQETMALFKEELSVDSQYSHKHTTLSTQYTVPSITNVVGGFISMNDEVGNTDMKCSGIRIKSEYDENDSTSLNQFVEKYNIDANVTEECDIKCNVISKRSSPISYFQTPLIANVTGGFIKTDFTENNMVPCTTIYDNIKPEFVYSNYDDKDLCRISSVVSCKIEREIDVSGNSDSDNRHSILSESQFSVPLITGVMSGYVHEGYEQNNIFEETKIKEEFEFSCNDKSEEDNMKKEFEFSFNDRNEEDNMKEDFTAENKSVGLNTIQKYEFTIPIISNVTGGLIKPDTLEIGEQIDIKVDDDNLYNNPIYNSPQFWNSNEDETDKLDSNLREIKLEECEKTTSPVFLSDNVNKFTDNITSELKSFVFKKINLSLFMPKEGTSASNEAPFNEKELDYHDESILPVIETVKSIVHESNVLNIQKSDDDAQYNFEGEMSELSTEFEKDTHYIVPTHILSDKQDSDDQLSDDLKICEQYIGENVGLITESYSSSNDNLEIIDDDIDKKENIKEVENQLFFVYDGSDTNGVSDENVRYKIWKTWKMLQYNKDHHSNRILEENNSDVSAFLGNSDNCEISVVVPSENNVEEHELCKMFSKLNISEETSKEKEVENILESKETCIYKDIQEATKAELTLELMELKEKEMCMPETSIENECEQCSEQILTQDQTLVLNYFPREAHPSDNMHDISESMDRESKFINDELRSDEDSINSNKECTESDKKTSVSGNSKLSEKGIEEFKIAVIPKSMCCENREIKSKKHTTTCITELAKSDISLPFSKEREHIFENVIISQNPELACCTTSCSAQYKKSVTDISVPDILKQSEKRLEGLIDLSVSQNSKEGEKVFEDITIIDKTPESIGCENYFISSELNSDEHIADLSVKENFKQPVKGIQDAEIFQIPKLTFCEYKKFESDKHTTSCGIRLEKSVTDMSIPGNSKQSEKTSEGIKIVNEITESMCCENKFIYNELKLDKFNINYDLQSKTSDTRKDSKDDFNREINSPNPCETTSNTISDDECALHPNYPFNDSLENINEIEENHNNANLEKLQNNEL